MIQTLLRRAASVGSAAESHFSLDSRVTFITGGSGGLQEVIAAVSGTIRNLDVLLSAVPGGAATRIITLVKNGTNTALTCTVTSAATTAQDTANDVSVVAGDRLRVTATLTATPATCDIHWSLDIDSDDTVSSMYGTNVGTNETGFVDPLAGEASATAADCQRLIPYPGMITAMWACSTLNTIGAGDALDFFLYLNGVKQDGTGGTVDTQTTVGPGAVGTAFSSTFSLVVARGDSIYIGVGPETATYGSTWTAVSIRYEADTAGVSIIAARSGNDPNTGSAYYHALTQAGTLWGPTDVASQRLYCGVTDIGLSYLILDSTDDPGAGNTRTFEVMKNGSVPGGAPAGVISAGVLRIDDTVGAVDFTAGDVIGPMRHTPASTPTTSGQDYWSMAMYLAYAGPPTPPSPPGGGGGVGTGIDPTVSDLSTGVKRVFMRLTLGQGSPYTEMAFGETMLRDDPAWFGGKKLPRLVEVSPITRALAESIRGVEVRVVLADDDTRPFRTLAATEALSGAVAEIFVVEDAVRYALGEPYRLFCGKVHEHRALPGFRYELTLRDVLSEEIAILDDAPRMPPGKLSVGDFPGMLPAYEGRSVQLVLGQCNDSNEPGNITQGPQGVIPPVILGQVNFTYFGGIDQNVIACLWSQCALAANGVWEVWFNDPTQPLVRIMAMPSDFGVYLWTPGMPGWSDTGLATDYIDYPLPLGPTTRRYTPFFVNADTAYAQPFLDGKILVAGNLYGIAENSDGSGLYLDDAPRIWQWLLCNFLFTEYMTGAYAAIPDFAGIYSIINTDSVVLTTTRLQAFGSGTYPVGFMLGREGQQQTLRHVLEELCAGVAMETGIDRHGRLMLDVEYPTATAVATFSALSDIEDGSFEVWIDREGYRNRINYVHGFRYVPPSAPVETPPAGEALPAVAVQPYLEWTSGLQFVESAPALAANNGRPRVEFLENYVVRSAAVALSVADRLLTRAIGPTPSYDGPRMFRFRTSWQGLYHNGVEIELGTVIAITHLEGLGASGWTARKARVLTITVDPLNARVTLEGRILYSGGGGE